MPQLRVMHVSSEVYPFSKTGGLADVLGVLPRTQAELGAQVTVVSPWYANLGGARAPEPLGQVQVPGVQGESEFGLVRDGGVDYVFIRQEGFETAQLYGLTNDIERFVKFCRAVPYTSAFLEGYPHILHVHDWAAALLPALVRYTDYPSPVRVARTVCTVHNLQYQGRWNPWDVLAWSGLPTSLLGPDGLEFYGDVNLLKAGIVYADCVSTVSPTYAREITTPAYGEKLEGVLRRAAREGRLVGILNGLDMERWNPRTDPHAAFDSLEGKAQVKRTLLEELGLPDRPTLGLVGRLAGQKGMDTLLEALDGVLERWNVVMLGSGDRFLERIYALLGKHAPGLAYHSGYQEALSHRIYAGSDAFLMPSRFEPCGLSQMVAMRYGTLPVVRDTGGLHDTVSPDVGFLFPEVTPESLQDGVNRALEVYETHPDEWRSRMEKAMQLDWSWTEGAKAYLALYERLAGVSVAG